MAQESATFIQVLFNLILLIAIYLTLHKSYYLPFRISPISRNVGIILILLFCLFAFWGGDYFHYKDAFIEYNLFGVMRQEKVYEWFYSTFSFSYIFLRLSIWGMALFALFWAYKRISPTFDLVLFIFGVCFLPIFSYARASLAMSIIILGLSFVSVIKKHNWLSTLIIVFSMLGISYFFHKSAPLGIAMAVVSLFMINADRKVLLLIVLITPLIVVGLRYAFAYFAIMDLDGELMISDHYRTHFLDVNTTKSGETFALGVLLNRIITRFPAYLIAILYICVVWSGEFKKLNIGERVISSYSFCVTLLAVLFLFDMGYSTNVLYYRTLFFSMPASAVFLAAVKRCELKPKLFKIVFNFSVFSGFYQILYSAYCALAK